MFTRCAARNPYGAVVRATCRDWLCDLGFGEAMASATAGAGRWIVHIASDHDRFASAAMRDGVHLLQACGRRMGQSIWL